MKFGVLGVSTLIAFCVAPTCYAAGSATERKILLHDQTCLAYFSLRVEYQSYEKYGAHEPDWEEANLSKNLEDSLPGLTDLVVSEGNAVGVDGYSNLVDVVKIKARLALSPPTYDKTWKTCADSPEGQAMDARVEHNKSTASH